MNPGLRARVLDALETDTSGVGALLDASGPLARSRALHVVSVFEELISRPDVATELRGRLDAAVDYLRVAGGTDAARALLCRARVALAAGAPEDALRDLDAVLDAPDPEPDLERAAWLTRPSATLLVDGVDAARGELEGLRLVARGGVELGGLWRAATTQLAELLLDLERPEGATALVGELEYEVRDAHSHLLGALVHEAVGRHREGLARAADALLAASGEDRADLHFRALLLVARLDPRRATAALEAASDLAARAGTRAGRAFLLAAARHAEQANRPVQAAEHALAALPGADARSAVEIAELLVDLGRGAEAVPALDVALDRCAAERRKRLQGRAWLAAARAAPGTPQAAEFLDGAVSRLARAPTVWRARALLAWANGKLDEGNSGAAEAVLVPCWDLIRDREEPDLRPALETLRGRLSTGSAGRSPSVRRPDVPGVRVGGVDLLARLPGAPDPREVARLGVCLRRGTPNTLRAVLGTMGTLPPSLAHPLARRLAESEELLFAAAAPIAGQALRFRAAFMAALVALDPPWLGAARRDLRATLQID